MDEPPFLLITEFLSKGDLKNYLKKPEAKEKLPFDKLILISANVSCILIFCLIIVSSQYHVDNTLTLTCNFSILHRLQLEWQSFTRWM